MVGSVNLPRRKRGRRNAERRALVTAAAYFLDRQETEAHGNAFRRSSCSVVALVRASGDLATLGDFAPLACPRPASFGGRPREWGRTDTQVLPRTKSHVSP